MRSSRSYLVKVSGLRWICLMWLGNIPWAGRYWALPVLTALAPSARYYQRSGRAPQKLTDRARQIIMQLRRWLPHRPLVLVGDSGYAVLDLLHFCQSLDQPVTFITRLRLDAGLYEPAPIRQTGQNGRPRVKGQRLPTLKALLDHSDVPWMTTAVAWYDNTTRTVELTSQTAVWYHTGKPPVPLRWVLIRDPQCEFAPQALLCTDPAIAPVQILEWFVLRWQLEVTFMETRAHLGVETQRQWSDRAIARTTPALMGIFSWITLAATCCGNKGTRPIAPPPGMPSQRQPSSTPSHQCGDTCGWRLRVFQCQRQNLTFKKFRPICTADLSIRWPTQLECTKPSLGQIPDEVEFRHGLENGLNVQVIVVKH